jgi:uncharacterized protein (TIGR02466 family)
MDITRLFVTEIYRASLLAGDKGGDRAARALNADIEQAVLMLAEEDEAGQAWCRDNAYGGYTSYGSLNDLPRRASCFADLARRLQKHAGIFTDHLELDLQGRKLVLDNLWVNVLQPGAAHSGHIHPHCVLSGTYYVRTPKNASAIRFEDPRLAMMMASPLPRADADPERRRFVHIQPAAGDLLLWESWLRHEVPPNGAASRRISVSFNYRWD